MHSIHLKLLTVTRLGSQAVWLDPDMTIVHNISYQGCQVGQDTYDDAATAASAAAAAVDSYDDDDVYYASGYTMLPRSWLSRYYIII